MSGLWISPAARVVLEELLRPRKGAIVKMFSLKREPTSPRQEGKSAFHDQMVRDNRIAALLIKNLRSEVLDDPLGDFGFAKLFRVGTYLDQRLQSIFEESADAELYPAEERT